MVMAAYSTDNIEKHQNFNTFDHNPNRSNGANSPPLETQDGEAISKYLIKEALRNKIEDIDEDVCDAGDEDTFFVADLGKVYRQHLRWKKHLGRVQPHYAVKCNPDPNILRLLSELGTGFDCASKWEIEQVLALGVDPSRIIYAQPCKTKSYVRYAAKEGVKQMTFDNADELYKIKQFFPEAELFLRILTDDSASLCRLSLKFGASLDSTDGLLRLAGELGLNVVGVAFHVGSGASDPQAFYKAVTDARYVFDQAAGYGFNFKTLDVGGGFVGETFEQMAAVLSRALDEHFPPQVRIIGEPGRYYASDAFTIACHIIARRTVDAEPAGDGKSYMLYLNDGVYGNFSSIMFDHQHPEAKILRCRNRVPMTGDLLPTPPASDDEGAPMPLASKLDEDLRRSSPVEYSIWGPTCDGIDCIVPSCHFPGDQVLNVGDWLYFDDMGAYTTASATRFNGFKDRHEVLYVCSEPRAAELLGM